MTAIAAFKSGQFPILVGDLLITNGQSQGSSRKKIMRLTENIALGWTGHEIAASVVVGYLQEIVGRVYSSFESVKAALIKFDTNELGQLEVVLIGWVLDAEGQHCFRWRSDYPHEVYFGAPMFDGSGGAALEARIHNGLSDTVNSAGNLPLRALQNVLHVTTDLIKFEMVGPTTFPAGFGYGYEILWAINGKLFQYARSVLYFALKIDFNEDGKVLRVIPSGKMFKYEAHGETSLLFMKEPDTDSGAADFVTPVGRPMELSRELGTRMRQGQNKFPFSADHYCAFVEVTMPDLTPPPFIFLTDKKAAKTQRIIEIGNDGLRVMLPREWLENTYKVLRADMNGPST